MYPYQNLSLQNMENEIWKDIEGYNGMYSISNFGRVKSNTHINYAKKQLKDRILRFTRNHKGYLLVRLYQQGICKSFSVARLVAIHFIDNPDNKPTVDHINADKNDNSVNNLRWATHHENQMNPILRKLRHDNCEKRRSPKIKHKDGRTKQIIALNLHTGEIKIYESIKDSAIDGFKPNEVSRVCCKTRNSLFGWKFFYSNSDEIKAYLPNQFQYLSHKD